MPERFAPSARIILFPELICTVLLPESFRGGCSFGATKVVSPVYKFIAHLKCLCEIYLATFLTSNGDKNCITTAVITTAPPKSTVSGGFSFANIHAHKGPKTASVNIIIPTNAEGVDLAPIVISIKPSPT